MSTQRDNRKLSELKTSRLNIRVEPSFKEELKAMADKEGRTLANFVIFTLQEKLNKESES